MGQKLYVGVVAQANLRSESMACQTLRAGSSSTPCVFLLLDRLKGRRPRDNLSSCSTPISARWTTLCRVDNIGRQKMRKLASLRSREIYGRRSLPRSPAGAVGRTVYDKAGRKTRPSLRICRSAARGWPATGRPDGRQVAWARRERLETVIRLPIGARHGERAAGTQTLKLARSWPQLCWPQRQLTVRPGWRRGDLGRYSARVVDLRRD